jgi:hypothetical protein
MDGGTAYPSCFNSSGSRVTSSSNWTSLAPRFWSRKVNTPYSTSVSLAMASVRPEMRHPQAG